MIFVPLTTIDHVDDRRRRRRSSLRDRAQSVDEILRIRGESVRIDTIGDTAVATVRGRRLPMVSLAELMGLAGEKDQAATLAIVSTRGGDYALVIDQVIDTEDLVVKPAAPAVMATGLYAGQTLPDSGQPMLLLDGSGLATMAGLRFDKTLIADEAPVEQTRADAIPALLFEDLDGQRRVMPLAAIDRVEPVSVDAIRRTAGKLRLAIGGALVPLQAVAPFGDRRELPVLRLTDGSSEIAYAIHEPVEIVHLPDQIRPRLRLRAGCRRRDYRRRTGGIARRACAVRGRSAATGRAASVPVAGGWQRWMETFLRPMLDAAGYRCVTQPPADVPVDVRW